MEMSRLVGENEYLSCLHKFYQTFLDDSNNDINICVWLRTCKAALIVLAFQPELTKPEMVYLDMLVDKASSMRWGNIFHM